MGCCTDGEDQTSFGGAVGYARSVALVVVLSDHFEVGERLFATCQ
jgi:hypothetical protein